MEVKISLFSKEIEINAGITKMYLQFILTKAYNIFNIHNRLLFLRLFTSVCKFWLKF